MRLFNGLKSSRRQERENCRAEADDTFAWHQYRATKHISVNLILDIVLLRNASRVDDALDFYSVSSHAVEDHSGVKRRSFDRSEEFILRGVLQIPSQGNSAQIWIHQYGTITVIPRNPQQSSLACAIVLKTSTQSIHVRSCPQRDGIENISHGGKTSFDPREQRMHTALNYTTHSWHQIYRGSDSNDAS